MTMPSELIEAQAVDTWCRRYGSLPFPGSLLEQPAMWWLRFQALLAEDVTQPAVQQFTGLQAEAL